MASPSLLLHKKLSISDLSGCVLRTGRVVLPRVQVRPHGAVSALQD